MPRFSRWMMLIAVGGVIGLSGCGGSGKSSALHTSPHFVSQEHSAVGINHFPWRSVTGRAAPNGPLWCHGVGSDGRLTGHRFDARSVLGLRVAAANRGAEGRGCTTRIVMVNGHGRWITADLRVNRIDLVVSRGLVTGVAVF